MASWKGHFIVGLTAAAAGGLVVFLAQHVLAPSVRLTEVQMLIKARDFDRAQRQLESFLRRNPDDPQAHLMLAGVLVTRGDPEKPFEHLRQVPDTSTWAIEARFQEGRMLRQLGQGADAEATWMRCLAVDHAVNPSNMSEMARNATVELLILYNWQKRHRESRELIWRWYRHVPENDRVRALVMLLNQEFGSPPPAEDILTNLKNLLAANPQDHHSRRALGRWLVELGQDVQQGLGLLKSCIEQHPEDLQSFVDYFWCLVEKGDLDGAEAALEQIPGGADKDAELWQLRGIVHELKERWQDAAQCFRKSLNLEPWRREAHAHLANVRRHAGDIEASQTQEQRAKELYEIEERLASATQWMATKQIQPAAGSAFEFAELQERRGRIDEARAWYAETLRLDPKHAGAKDALVRLGPPLIVH